jgi:hypothetical protein
MKTNLKKAFLTTVAALGLVMSMLGGASTWAADMCFLDDYNSVLVGKNFSFPSAGSCKAFDGYELGTSCIISGTACGTSDNGLIAFHLETSCPFVNYQGISNFRISRVNSGLNQAGYGYATQLNTGNFTVWHIKTVPCPNPHPLN